MTACHHESHVDPRVDHRSVEISHCGFSNRVVPLLALYCHHLATLAKHEVDAMVPRSACDFCRITLPLEDIGHEAFEFCTGHGTQSLQQVTRVRRALLIPK